MINRPSLMNSDVLFNTYSELPHQSNFDSKLSGEMSTMRQMLRETQQVASIGSTDQLGNELHQSKRKEGAESQSQHTGNFTKSNLRNPTVVSGTPHNLPFAATTSSFRLPSQPSQQLPNTQLSSQSSFYYDRAKQRPAFMKRTAAKKDSLRERKQSVQTVIVGGERMREILQDKERRRQQEKEDMMRWKRSASDEQLEDDVTKQERHWKQKDGSPCSWNNNSKKSKSGKKSPIKAKCNSGSSDSDSEDSAIGQASSLTPGAVDDTAGGRLLKKVIRLLRKQEEPNLGAIAELQRAAKKGVLQLMQLQLQHQSLKK